MTFENGPNHKNKQVQAGSNNLGRSCNWSDWSHSRSCSLEKSLSLFGHL